MSLGRKPLVEWMQENNHLYSSYHYSKESSYPAGKYFSFGLCRSNVSVEIQEYSTRALQRSTIAEIDKKTRQNSFHYVFSNELPKVKSAKADYFVLRTDHYHRITQVNCTYVHEHFNIREDLRKEEKLIPSQSAEGEKFTKNNLTTTIGLLLAPFENTETENHDRALVAAFSKKDSRGNTPLFYEYQKTSLELDNTALYDRIEKLAPNDLVQFLSAQNEAGKTLLHEVVSHQWPGDFSTQIARFGQNALKTALRQPDEKGDTPIHYLFSKRDAATALSFVDSICKLIKSSKQEPKNIVSHNTCSITAFVKLTTEEEKKPVLEQKQVGSSTDYLPVNLEGKNPLHVLCKKSVSEENSKIFKALLDVIPDKDISKKIMQLDRAGFTPVHYAIESGNLELALDMISKLSRADQMTLILMNHGPKKNPAENLLHYICRFGDRSLLLAVVEILGPAELHRVRSEMPLKLKEYRENPHLCQHDRDQILKNHSKLFDIFDYLVRTFRPDEKDFQERFEDFCACYAAIWAGQKVADMSSNFYSKKHGVFLTWEGSNTYQKLRHHLSNVSTEEQASFATYLAFMAADAMSEETTGATQSKQKNSDVAMVAQKILDQIKKIENKDKWVPALECKTEDGFVVFHTNTELPPPYVPQQSVPSVTSSYLHVAAPPPPAGNSTVNQGARPRARSC